MNDSEEEKTIEVEAYGTTVKMTPTQYAEWLKQRGNESHQDHFQDGGEGKTVAHVTVGGHDVEGKPIAQVDERSAKQHMRRADLLSEQMQSMALKRVAPGTGANVEYISFEKFVELQGDYEAALKVGETHNSAFERVGFQPLSVYVTKIAPEGKRQIRPILQHEVGIRPNGVIVLLEDKYPGDLGTLVVPVKEEVK